MRSSILFILFLLVAVMDVNRRNYLTISTLQYYITIKFNRSILSVNKLFTFYYYFILFEMPLSLRIIILRELSPILPSASMNFL